MHLQATLIMLSDISSLIGSCPHLLFLRQIGLGCFLTFPRGMPSLLHLSHTTGYAGHSVSWCCCKENYHNVVKISNKQIKRKQNRNFVWQPKKVSKKTKRDTSKWTDNILTYYISKLVGALWLVNLAGRTLLYGQLKFKVVFVAKLNAPELPI